jgi:mitogen-activated protein kinase 15
MPSSDDINHLQSQAAQQLICKFKHIRQKRRLNQWYSDLTPLVIEMLQFNPHKRLTFEQALKNPLFLNYGGIGIEALSDLPIVTKLDDDRCFSIQRYRSAIYDEIRRKYNDL